MKTVNLSRSIITRVGERLFLGNASDAINRSLLSELNIQCIVQLIDMNPVPALDSCINYLKMPIRGGVYTDISPILQRALVFIHSAVVSGQSVLVHCKFGKNRSASVIIAYVMAYHNMKYPEAERYVAEKRPIISVQIQTKQYLSKLGPEGIRKLIG